MRIVRFIKKYTIAVLSCLFTFTFGVFSSKKRIAISDICRIYGYEPKIITPHIPKVLIQQIVNENITFQIHEEKSINGNITLMELVVIAKLIAHYKPLKLFEIGTFDGRTTLNMAANSPVDAKVYTLDLPKEEMNSTALILETDDKNYINKDISGSRYIQTQIKSKIVQLYGDSAKFNFKPLFNTMDFVFIDGAHSYNYVLNDSAISLRLLKDRKGVIVWHDYDSVWEGVTEALNRLYENDIEYSKIKHISGTSLVCFISI
jgi:predicted O-methyltransferase YrrM